VTVASAMVGNAIGADKRITAPTETFGRNDTLYVSVATLGSGTATLKANWSYYTADGKLVPVKEESQTIQAAGPAATEFHVSKPDGWPAGNYQVEILLNDQRIVVKRFTVK
jgi:hypothetical protein